MAAERRISIFGVGVSEAGTARPRQWQAYVTDRHRLRWILVLIAALALALLAWVFLHPRAAKSPPVPAIPVTLVKAERQDVPISIGSLGAAQAWTSVAVLAQVSGKLLSVDFTEGTDVKAGQVLAEIDPAPYRAVLTEAQGALKRDQALLANARIDLGRYRALQKQNAISDQQVATQAALVSQDEGTVLIDQGTVAAANVNLGWCRITSPIAGRAGVRLVDPGNLVSASGSVGSTPSTASSTNTSSATGNTNTGSSGGSSIVVVNQIQPIAVTFTVPEGEFQRLSDLSDGFRKPLETQAFSQETGARLGSGQLTIADNRIDPTTGTVELKARFANEQKHLWPGEFVNVRLTLEVLHNATTIPVAAVNRGPDGNFAFVVGKNGRAAVRPVVVAWTQGSVAVIGKGIAPGDVVVTDGQMILKAGSLVKPISGSSEGRSPA